MWRSLSCLSFLAAEMKPGAQSVTIVIGPGCRIGVVSDITPDFKSSSFSDGISVVEIMEVKWSMRIRMFCLALFITSA